jgi:integrase
MFKKKARPDDDQNLSTGDYENQLVLCEDWLGDAPEMAANRARMNDLRASRHAPATVSAYRSDWEDFVQWCEKHSLSPLPAIPETVALYISHLVPLRKHSTLGRRVAAIAWKHKSQEIPAPITPLVRSVLAGARRRNPQPPVQKAAMSVPELLKVSEYLAGDPTIRNVRDRAIILLGFAGSFRRSELCNLNLADIDLRDDRVIVKLGRTKTDQTGKGREIVIPRANRAELCAVRSLAVWLKERGSWAGPLFCDLKRSGAIVREKATGSLIYYALRTACRRAGLDQKRFGAHSLRAGAITAAAASGANVFDIMSLSGHRSYDNVARYVRPAEPNYPLRKVL